MDLKPVLENLNSALGLLEKHDAELIAKTKEVELQQKKQDEQDAVLKAKSIELDAREGKIANIESIVEFSNQAKDLMKSAKEAMKNADERQKILENGLKKLAEDKEKLEKEYQDKNIALVAQAEALKKERAEFNEKIKAYKAVSAALK